MKVRHRKFPLARHSHRVALLTGIIAGVVQEEEIRHHVVQDIQLRPYKKPVHALGVRYDSVTDAARALAGRRATHSEIEAMRVKIARWCEQDCWEGYYWCE